MKNIAIIPARSGSKGLKDKNIKLLNGKPLIAYTIEAAIKSKQFDEVVVSTDSPEYADIARKYGASVPYLRNEVLSSDTASSMDVMKDILKKYEIKEKHYDTVALLQPTSPFRNAADIIEGYNLYNNKNANVIVSVCEVEHSPLWSNILPGNHSLDGFLNQDLLGLPRQSLPTYYRLNGAIYIMNTEYIIKADNIYDENSYALIMPKERSIDIDDAMDFQVASAMIIN